MLNTKQKILERLKPKVFVYDKRLDAQGHIMQLMLDEYWKDLEPAVSKALDEVKREAKKEVVNELINLCHEYSDEYGIDSHLFKDEIVTYSKSKGIDIK